MGPNGREPGESWLGVCVLVCTCVSVRGTLRCHGDTSRWERTPFCGRHLPVAGIGVERLLKHLDCKSAAHEGENGWICVSPSWAPSKEGPGPQGGQGTPRWRSCNLQSKAEPGAGVGAKVRLPAHLQARPSGLPSIRAAPAVVLRGTQWWLPSGLCPGSITIKSSSKCLATVRRNDFQPRILHSGQLSIK